MNKKSDIKNEDGSTLVETLVAMTILVSVLLPSSLFLGYISANPLNKEKITALGLAQNEMEEVLADKKYVNEEKVVEDKWVIKRTTSKEENLIYIEVHVYRKNKPESNIILNTERLLYENDTQ